MTAIDALKRFDVLKNPCPGGTRFLSPLPLINVRGLCPDWLEFNMLNPQIKRLILVITW